MDSLARFEGPPTLVRLPSGSVVRVRTCRFRFEPWTGDPAQAALYFRSGKNPKPVVDLDGQPMFPELAVLRLLQRDGWRGVWADSFSRRYLDRWSTPPVSVTLPPEHTARLERIPEARGRWDVLAWRDGEVLFVDAKWKGKDRSTPPQLKWLEAALDSGVELSSFLLVEWDFEDQPPRA